MKYITLFFFTFCTFCFVNCKKTGTANIIKNDTIIKPVDTIKPHIPVERLLDTLPLDSLKWYINGNWKFVKTISGLGVPSYPQNSYMYITQNQTHIKNIYDGIVYTDTSIVWNRTVADLTNDSTWEIKFYEAQNLTPTYLVIHKSVDDTMVLYENYTLHGVTGYLLKN